MKIQFEKMKMREKPNFRRRTINNTQFKEIKTMHTNCERYQPQRQRQLIHNAMNHLHSVHNVFVIAALALLVMLLQPTIVKCDNNNNVLNEIDNGGEVHAKSTLTELSGGRVIGEKWLRQTESPYSLEMDLTVERSGKLFIEPGVTVHVAPMVGITVRGVLTALGTANDRIVLTTQTDSGYSETITNEPKKLGARLVDGPSPLAGRLQIFYENKWRSVCTNSRNWTISDYETLCRQMGFKGGRFWNWVERLSNYESRLLYEDPNCQGIEGSLSECAWQTIQIGSGVCDYHNDIGVQCLPLHETLTPHWRGVRFEFAPSEQRLAPDNTNYEQISMSELRYVDIVKAGSGNGRSTNAAIEILGIPPTMNFVTVDRSAFTGINVTKPDAGFSFNEVTVQKSRGIGIFVNTSSGLAHFNRVKVSDNGDDGIRYVSHDLRSDERTDRNSIYDFCTLPTTAGQTYPISVSLQQSEYATISKECFKYFFTRHGYFVTVNFVHFVVQNNETAHIDIFDGSSSSDRLLATWAVRNYTRPQSVTSTREKIFVRFRADPRSKILGFLKLTTAPFKSYDLNVTKSVISNNGGRGVAVDYMRSQVHIHESSILSNGHVAGVHITSGAGDVNITQSRISMNQGDGINITYYGGNRNISRNSIASNMGYGVAIWLNHTAEKDRQEFISFNQTSVVEYSNFFHNLETGILHGNFCTNHWVNITGNRFNDSQSNSIDIQSCWFSTINNEKLKLQIGHNVFENDNKIGIIMSPALNLDGNIEWNHFQYGKYGSLLIRNKPLDEFLLLPVHLTIHHNQFFKNQGIYVVSLGLTPYSDRDVQYLLFTRNFVRMNKIAEPFVNPDDDINGSLVENRLSPRSRVAAPVVISSSNVEVFRNIIHNRESRYEVGSQVSDQSKVLNVTYNWLGHKDEEQIFNRLFHRKDRYDLAKIEYMPYLLHNSNPGANTIMSITQFVPRFFNEGSDVIGGEVDGQEMLPTGTYSVDRDINIRPGGKLILHPGVILNFAPSVGMMVSGKLEARGRNPDDIFFTLKRTPVITFENETADGDIDMEMETESVVIVEQKPNVPIRLLGGATEMEGRLQVHLDGKWGTVCDYGFEIQAAALVCHQLGYALNPSDWQLQRSELPNAGTSEDVILSHVQCTEHDIDITKCRSERASKKDFFNSCTHAQDVGIRCYESAWAGVRFGVLAESTDLQYITIEKAGLFDYATNTFKPALQMDFARHNLENVRVVNNLNDGLGIVYSDIFGGSINNVKNSEFSMNRGSGISLKQLGLRVQGSVIKDNYGPGIIHTPVIQAMEQRELAGWFSMAPDFNIHDSDYHPYILPTDIGVSDINVDIWTKKYLLTSRVVGVPMEKTINIHCAPGYVIAFQLLNPIQNGSTENIWIYDSQTPSNNSNVYEMKRDLTVFPVTSSSYGVMLRYSSGTNAFGGVVLVISSITAPVQNIYNRIVRGPVPTLYVTSTKIQRNQKGLMATYYNRYLGDRAEHFMRKANESIKFTHCEISHNREEAIFVLSPFWDVHSSNLSEITIHLNNSLVTHNGRGIRQYSKDLRSSNNLFHYVIQGTTFEDNLNGGFDISLPYVWQYNENFTHSVYLGNDTWIRNKNFGIQIMGHFAQVNISGNTFRENDCLTGLIGFRGMEKKLRIDGNLITNNNAKYVVQFRADSLSEILGEVFAIFAYNKISNNRNEGESKQLGLPYAGFRYNRWFADRNPTCVICFGGIQKVRIYRNLLVDNKLQYDLIAGVRSARLQNFLDATENWWGSTDVKYILSRIFDFDDWNNHAEVLFKPFLVENNFDGSLSPSIAEKRPIDIDNLGGRIFEDLALYRRGVPYIVNSDITVMPGVTLTIHPGTHFEFAENVGILVLGTLIARGYPDGRIVMRSQKQIVSQDIPFKAEPQLDDNRNDLDSIRLCKNGNCSNDHNDVEPITDGFLEYFNHTTLQWVPICDRRFTERNAQVVCRELGFNYLDVYFNHGERLEYHINSLTRIWSWVQPLECKGDEPKFSRCIERLNGQLYGHRHECKWHDKFVFVSCNGNADIRKYWGGIRFAHHEFEHNTYEHRIHNIHTHTAIQADESVLEFIDIDSAGMLHGEKSAAVQVISKAPTISSLSITNGANHGVNLVSPSDTMHLKLLNIHNVLGQGINGVSLSGEGRESDESSFAPLKALDMPYHLFSLIDICDTSKVIVLEERVILYYKYDNDPVNCVKIFNSAYRVKPIGFRLLQSNLFNHSKLYGRRDSIHLFDGDLYNLTAKHISTVEADGDNANRLFRTTGPILSVRLVASGAPSTHGFFAEVVTLPASAIGFNRDAQLNVSLSEISGAVGGAVTYATAGEVSPRLTLENNRFISNCRQLYGNFSTCEAAITLDVQNMQTFHFQNNLVKGNQGGILINADSRGSATSLRAYIHHNLFVNNRNRPSLSVEGRQSSPYQEVTIFKNYFSQNRGAYADVVSLRQVVSNFSYNYVHSNQGGRIIEVSGFDKVRLPIYQTTAHNGFYENVATDWHGRATIVAGTAGQQYVDNIFYNPDNDYEMITVNRSIFEFQFWNSTVDLWKTRIDATHNYWNYNDTLAVSGRIRDKSDDPLLLEVNYAPFQLNNKTILDDKCPPGWSLILDTCYMYVGAPMTFFEAREFCRSDNATMPFIRGSTDILWLYLQRQMVHLRYPDRVWIQDLSNLEQCTSFLYRTVEIDDCSSKRGFICEIDPKVVLSPLSWQTDIVAVATISAFILTILLLFMFIFCWCSKSHHRHVQRLQRRNSIRQSLRSLNTIDPQGSLRRRNYSMTRSTDTLTKSIITAPDYKKMSKGSIDSMDKSVISSNPSLGGYDPQNMQQRYVTQAKSKYSPTNSDGSTAKKPSTYEQKLTNAPSYDPYGQAAFELSYRNQGFRDNSSFNTRNNSYGTNINDDTPIVHHTDQADVDDTVSDYYGKSNTLPINQRNNDNLSFLSELKSHLPEYEQLNSAHSSFLPSSNDPSPNSFESFTQEKKSNTSSASHSPKSDKELPKVTATTAAAAAATAKKVNDYAQPNIRLIEHETRRPNSYYTAMQNSRDSKNVSNNPSPGRRPKAVYQSSNGYDKPIINLRSKSEALLEANFEDTAATLGPQMKSDNKSYSQPMETAM